MGQSHAPHPPGWTGRADITRNLRLWLACFRLSIVRETQFRGNFLATIVVGLAQILIGIIPVLVIFSYTGEVNGWSQADVIVVLGVQQAMMGLLGMFLVRNMWALSEDILSGDLDQMLLRPVDALFHAATRWIRPDQAFNVMTGIIVVAVGLARGAGWPGFTSSIQAIILFLAGFLLLAITWTAVSCCAFWTQSMMAITLFFRDVLEAGRYPVWFFPIVLRLMLTFIVPLAFATTFPAQAVTNGVEWWIVLAALGFCIVAMAGLRLLWRTAIRSYASASS